MSKTDLAKIREAEKQVLSISHHVVFSGSATFFAHPTRVFLNRASLYQWPLQTIIDSRPYLFKGLGFNFIRGTMATGVQSYSKQVVQEQIGFWGGLGAASFCGTLVAISIETPFIRKTMAAGYSGGDFSLWRFNRSLSTLYFVREMGFSLAVLAKNDLSSTAQYGVLVGGAWATAVAHKFAALEAIRDRLSPGVTVPDFRQGITYTLRSMAQGGVYTHPVFQVPFEKPLGIFAKAGNILHVSCGLNMYLFRLLYLATFREAYHLAAKAEPAVSATWSSFFKKPKEPGLADLTVNEQRIEFEDSNCPP